MNKQDLKRALRPLIKECVKEVLTEEGVLSGIVAEVLMGVQAANAMVLTEAPVNYSRQQPAQPARTERTDLEVRREAERADRERRRKILESRNQMSKTIAEKNNYNGVNLFEGTEPIGKAGVLNEGSTSSGPLSGIDPSDPGVDLGVFFNSAKNWNKLV